MLKNEPLRKAIHIFTEEYPFELNLQPATIENKRSSMKRFLAFVGERDFTVEVIRAYVLNLQKRSWKVLSIRTEIKAIKALSTFLYKRKYMEEDIAKAIMLPKLHKVPLKVLDPDVIEKIIAAGTIAGKGDRSRSKRIKEETKLALRFILRTGLRISEVVKLRGEDVNLDDDPPTFYVHSKGGDIETMPFPRDMVDELRDRTSRKRVFEITDKCCNETLQRGAKRLGITQHITNHTLRHIFATSNLKNGTPLQVVSRLMRHDSVAITDEVYSHYDIKDLAYVLNNQAIVKQGLTPDEIFDTVEQAVKRTGVEKDARFTFEVMRDVEGITMRILKKNITT